MSLPAAPPGLSSTTGFIVGTFVLATIIGGAVLYLGLVGDLGGPIPGAHVGYGQGISAPTPAACEGNDRMGNFSFSFVAGKGGSLTFNGTRPGPCVAVVVGSTIQVNFSVAPDAGTTHTWVLVNASNASTALSTPAFPGAGMTGAERFMGIGPGQSMVFHFTAAAVGSYQYICEMPGHYTAGMWGWFNVTNSPVPPSAAERAPPAAEPVSFAVARPN
ncbi:MAG: plastocyanin/azurin family copper-binding protein [Thermoplasmata archaeon]|jgi:plastocyanin|nr:plastocyanin/azurin family copper-binding protein [Thermoplasmata archaeon]